MGDGFQADDAARLGNKRVERERRAVPAGCVELAGRGERGSEGLCIGRRWMYTPKWNVFTRGKVGRRVPEIIDVVDCWFDERANDNAPGHALFLLPVMGKPDAIPWGGLVLLHPKSGN